MKQTSSLAFRIALVFSILVAVLLNSVILITETRMRSEIGGFSRAENLQITHARADEIGMLLDKILWQTKMIAARPEFQTMDTDPAKAVATIISLSGKLSPEVVGCFVADPTGAYTSVENKSGNVADRDYFGKIMKEGLSSFIGAPVISKSLGIPIVVVAAAIKAADGSTMGFIGSQLSLSDLSKVLSDIQVGQTGYGWIIDQTGLVIADKTPENIMKLNVTNADQLGYRGMDDTGKKMISEVSGEALFTAIDGTPVTTYFTRIEQSPGWVLGINIATNEVARITNEMTTLLVTMLVVGLVLTLIVSVIIGRRFVHALGLAAAAFRKLAEGDADLTAVMPVRTKDEVGELASGFNEFLVKLRQIVTALKHSQNDLGRIGSGLKGSVEETRVAVSDMSGNILRVQEESRLQSISVSESSSAVEEIAKNIESLDHLIADQAASIIEASASIEQMVGNIGAIGNSTDQMANQFTELSTAAAAGRSIQDLATQKITQIAELSESLLEANKVIANIASQTNLLAMNAAIEAAHAGEAGKGFSVVADEIRRLAETSAEQSRSITIELTKVQEGIKEVVSSSHDSGEAFDQVAQRIKETDTLVRSVRQAMAEQQAGSTQILQALKAMNEVTSQVRQGSGEMKNGNQTILGEIQQLKTSTGDISRTMETLVESTQKITAGSDRVGEMADGTSNTISEMETVIGRFKV